MLAGFDCLLPLAGQLETSPITLNAWADHLPLSTTGTHLASLLAISLPPDGAVARTRSAAVSSSRSSMRRSGRASILLCSALISVSSWCSAGPLALPAVVIEPLLAVSTDVMGVIRVIVGRVTTVCVARLLDRAGPDRTSKRRSPFSGEQLPLGLLFPRRHRASRPARPLARVLHLSAAEWPDPGSVAP